MNEETTYSHVTETKRANKPRKDAYRTSVRSNKRQSKTTSLLYDPKKYYFLAYTEDMSQTLFYGFNPEVTQTTFTALQHCEVLQQQALDERSSILVTVDPDGPLHSVFSCYDRISEVQSWKQLENNS